MSDEHTDITEKDVKGEDSDLLTRKLTQKKKDYKLNLIEGITLTLKSSSLQSTILLGIIRLRRRFDME